MQITKNLLLLLIMMVSVTCYGNFPSFLDNAFNALQENHSNYLGFKVDENSKKKHRGNEKEHVPPPGSSSTITLNYPHIPQKQGMEVSEYYKNTRNSSISTYDLAAANYRPFQLEMLKAHCCQSLVPETALINVKMNSTLIALHNPGCKFAKAVAYISSWVKDSENLPADVLEWDKLDIYKRRWITRTALTEKFFLYSQLYELYFEKEDRDCIIRRFILDTEYFKAYNKLDWRPTEQYIDFAAYFGLSIFPGFIQNSNSQSDSKSLMCDYCFSIFDTTTIKETKGNYSATSD